MANTIMPKRRDADTVAFILGSPEFKAFIAEIEADYIVGRRGFGPHRLIAATLCKFLFVLPTWVATVETIRGNPRLMSVCGCADESDVPSVHALYRFSAKLGRHNWLENLAQALQAGVRELKPQFGRTIAGDGTDLQAFANGQRFVKKGGAERLHYSDPDATWGHRGSVSTRSHGGYYGYKAHGLVCVQEELPVAWKTTTASADESKQVEALLHAAAEHGFKTEVAIFDRGYDGKDLYNMCHARGLRVVIPLARLGKGQPAQVEPSCTHGRTRHRWVYSGTDMKRGATKWRCPIGECRPKSVWIPLDRLHPAIPRSTPRSRKLYMQRGAVERFWSRLKVEWGLNKRHIRVRRLERVSLFVDLTVITYLALGLAKLRCKR